MKKYIFAILALVIISCSKEEDPLSIDVDAYVKKTSTTKADIRLNRISNDGKIRVLYKPVNSNEEYKSAEYPVSIGNPSGLSIILSNLNKATKYQFVFEKYNDKSSVRSNPFYFITKAVDFDYQKFYSDKNNSGDRSNSIELFSHNNRTHVIHGAGLSDYSNVKLYLINEAKTDSISLPTLIVADSLSFTIPENYLNENQSPRESFKKAIIGIKIKDAYQYFYNSSSWNYESFDQSDYYAPSVPLVLKIFNTKPFINTIDLLDTNDSACPNSTLIRIKGEFLGYWKFYYWTPQKAQLILYESNGTVYNTYDYDYLTGQTNNPCASLGVYVGDILAGGLLQYHQRNQIVCKTLLAKDTYKVKVIFTFSNGSTVETNVSTFTKS
jgi:hypothetical protein